MFASSTNRITLTTDPTMSNVIPLIVPVPMITNVPLTVVFEPHQGNCWQIAQHDAIMGEIDLHVFQNADNLVTDWQRKMRP